MDDYEALLDDLLALHRGTVMNVHSGTHHSHGRRRMFSECACGWRSGPVVVPDDYDVTVPKPCPTTARIDTFRTTQRAEGAR